MLNMRRLERGTSKNILSNGFQTLLAQTSARALTAVFDAAFSVTSAVGRGNGPVTRFLYTTPTVLLY